MGTKSGTAFKELFERLAAEFAPGEVKVRSHDKARYVTARTVMNRLDEVIGPENWWTTVTPWSNDAAHVALSVRLPSGDVITKQDVGARTRMAEQSRGKSDPGDDDKGAVSDGIKRAAVQFGIGRYLYRDGIADLHGGDEGGDPEPAAPPPPAGQEPGAKVASGLAAAMDAKDYRAWVELFIPWMNKGVAKKRPELPAGFVFIDETTLEGAIHRMLVKCGAVPDGGDAKGALVSSFGADPEKFHAAALEACRARLATLSAVKPGIPEPAKDGAKKRPAAAAKGKQRTAASRPSRPR